MTATTTISRAAAPTTDELYIVVPTACICILSHNAADLSHKVDDQKRRQSYLRAQNHPVHGTEQPKYEQLITTCTVTTVQYSHKLYLLPPPHGPNGPYRRPPCHSHHTAPLTSHSRRSCRDPILLPGALRLRGKPSRLLRLPLLLE